MIMASVEETLASAVASTSEPTSAPSSLSPSDASSMSSETPSTSYQLPSHMQTRKKYQQLTPVTHDQIIFGDIMDNCFVKSALSGAMGGAAGLAFGLFSASLDNAGGGFEAAPMTDHADKPTRVVLREMLKHMKTKSLSFAKSFAVLGALYSFNECTIEKFRAKHDIVNPALAGCVTGGMLAYQAGPQAMCIGCASFAAFSVAIEHFLQT